MAKTKELTPLQTAFLDALFDPEQANGDYKKAVRIAGYDKTTKVASIVAALRDEILDRARDLLVANAVVGAQGLLDLVEKPNQLGGKVKLDAIKEILDRAGLQKVEKTELSVGGEGGIFILPAKKND